MNELKLRARRRSVFGKHLCSLRQRGLLPARVYGPHTASLALEVDAHDFERIWKRARSLTLVKLDVEGEERTVLIRDVQREATSDHIVHADLYEIAMTDRLRVSVPIVLKGEAPASARGGVLLRVLDALQVESLPRDLPQEMDVDVSRLDEFDAGIHVADIAAPEGVTILTPGEDLIVKVAAPTIEVEEVVPPLAPPAEAEAGAAETAEGDAQAEAGA